MKKIYLLMAFGFLLMMQANAQRQNVIKTNPFGMFNGNYLLTYERMLSPGISGQITGKYLDQEEVAHPGYNNQIYHGMTDKRGYSIMPEVRFYAGRSGMPKGFYASLFTGYSQINENFTDFNSDSGFGYMDETIGLSGGVLVGLQALLGQRVALDLFAGPQYTSEKTERSYHLIDPAMGASSSQTVDQNNGIGLKAGFRFGIAF